MTVNGKPITANTTITISAAIAVAAFLWAIYEKIDGNRDALNPVITRLTVMEEIGKRTGDDINAIRVSFDAFLRDYRSSLTDVEKRLSALETKVK